MSRTPTACHSFNGIRIERESQGSEVCGNNNVGRLGNAPLDLHDVNEL